VPDRHWLDALAEGIAASPDAAGSPDPSCRSFLKPRPRSASSEREASAAASPPSASDPSYGATRSTPQMRPGSAPARVWSSRPLH
jgi:hypothetical protein